MYIAANDGAPQGRLRCLRVDVASPWFAYFVPLDAFPLAAALRTQLLEAMTELLRAMRGALGLERGVWLLLDELHKEDAVNEISRNAAIWRPEMGMGMRPEGPSPKYWTGADLLDREYSEEMPVLKHTVVGLETDEAGAELACGLMTGRGGLIQVLFTGPAQAVTTGWYETLQPTIEEEGLAAYPLYVPLVGLASVTGQGAERLDSWMGRAVAYVRESAEDKGVVIVSRVSLERQLEALETMWVERPGDRLPASSRMS